MPVLCVVGARNRCVNPTNLWRFEQAACSAEPSRLETPPRGSFPPTGHPRAAEYSGETAFCQRGVGYRAKRANCAEFTLGSRFAWGLSCRCRLELGTKSLGEKNRSASRYAVYRPTIGFECARTLGLVSSNLHCASNDGEPNCEEQSCRGFGNLAATTPESLRSIRVVEWKELVVVPAEAGSQTARTITHPDSDAAR